jgi:Spy/CpxP family protein refolding chaperone
MRILHDLLYPKKRKTVNDKPDAYKEYSQDEVDRLVKIRDDADLKLQVARLTPYQRAKLNNILKERKSGRNHKT